MISQSSEAAMARIAKSMEDMHIYSDGVEAMLLQNLDVLCSQLGLAAYSDEPDPAVRTLEGDAETGPTGHRENTTTRRQGVGATRPYIPPPARGNHRPPTHSHPPRSFNLHDDTSDHVHHHRMPKMDVPKFDGDNPKLWQIQCEDYFKMYDTAPSLWVRLASLQFYGPAAKWLSSIKSLIRKYTWNEFEKITYVTLLVNMDALYDT
jgi:hypothetical protein